MHFRTGGRADHGGGPRQAGPAPQDGSGDLARHGFNLVPQWLAEGHVSLSATQLGNVDPEASYDDLKQQVEAAYQHKSYAYRGQRLEEFDRFIRRMSEGDLMLTPCRGWCTSAWSPRRRISRRPRASTTFAATSGG
jgi:hypothetical protein